MTSELIRKLNTGAASRAMFATPTTLNPMLRGPMVAYAPNDDRGNTSGDDNGATDDEDANTDANTEGEGDDDEEDANGAADDEDDGEGEGETKPKPTDAEAKLLREQMKTKKALKAARDAEKAAKSALAAYKGADPTKVAELLAREAEAETAALEAKGEYERVKEQMREQHAAAIAEKDTELASAREELAAANRQIDELTVGNDFGNSKFLNEQTVLSPAKARRLYGDHFEVVDGKTVGYDKPKGAADRTPLVDAQGNHLKFDAAIEKIVRADEDFERIAKSKLKPGSSSNGTQHKTDDTPAATTAPGVGRIAANLGKLATKDPKAK